MSKTRSAFADPTVLRRWAAEAAVYWPAPLVSIGPFGLFRRLPAASREAPENDAKTTPGRQRGNPRTVGSDSIEARENTHLRR
jgi:hypothetical protein